MAVKKISSLDGIGGDYIVAFSASWCGPCKILSPILEDVSEDVKIYKVDIQANPEISDKLGVRAIPTLMKFKDGVQVDKKLGLMTKEQILNW